MSGFQALEWRDDKLIMLDQRHLPLKTVYLEYKDSHSVANAITDMVVRGAPAIGAAAAWGLALVPCHTSAKNPKVLRQELEEAAKVLVAARPTAVNLTYAINRMLMCLNAPELKTIKNIREAAIAEANAIAEDEVRICKAISTNAQILVPDPAVIIHHCNTGALATVDYGTALGVIRMAHELGKKVFTLVDETRPRLQGARLTAWELQQYGVPFMVIADGASGYYMRTMNVDLCVVGCDRVAANGDTANKIGTYNLAVVAYENGVPFYIACPTTTIDMNTPNGEEIEIEGRDPREITHVGDCQITPDGVQVGNPAFDVTPARYITAIITDKGIAYPPLKISLAKLMSG